MQIEKSSEILPCQLTEDEKQRYGQEMAGHLVEVNRFREELAEIKKHYKEGIDPLEDRIQELATRIDSGIEERPVETEIHYDHDRKKVRVLRVDTWETVSERKMTLEEQQMPLLEEAV